MKNTKAKYLLEDIDVEEISHTIASGSATQKNGEMAYLCKGEDITLSEEEEKILESLTKAEELSSGATDIDKASDDENDSDIVSGSQLNVSDDNPDTMLNKNNEDNMTEEVKAPEVEVEKSLDVEVVEQETDLQKSLDELKTLLKAAQDEATQAKQEKEALEKAAEKERIVKAKADLTEVVKGWELENTEEVVESLFKSESASVLMKAMEDMNNRVESLKKSFGEVEHGEDQEAIIVDDFAKSQEDVAKILKARKEQRNSK